MSTIIPPIEHTLRILKRPPFRELDYIYRLNFWKFYENDALFVKWLDSVGYTKGEFFEDGEKYVRECDNLNK